MDKWHLIPGDPWQPAIEKGLAESETCAVFIGPSGFGPWQNEEMRAAIDRRVTDSKRRFRVIPVLLPGAERGERSSLPTFLSATTWVEFRDSLEDPGAFHRLISGIRGQEPGTEPGHSIYEGQCPYRGLRVFDVEDSLFFFGREALVEWLLNEVRPATESQPVNRFLAVVGASGSGKSSVARAGLVAALKHDNISGSSRWPIAIFRPGSNPLESLAVALSKAVNVGQGASALAELVGELQKNEKALHLTTRQSLPENARGILFVILVDQFEEVFTLCRNEDLREAFIRNLLYASKVAQEQTLVILTMRADFYAKCATNAELAAAFSDHHVLVGPMTDDELRRVIERPTKLVGCELEPGLVDLLLRDVSHQPGALPLLQHALLELWNKREGRRLTVKAYQEIGKLEGALQRRADATLEALSEQERELCRRTFLRLTQPGEGTEDTKRRASVIELLSLADTPAAEESIIQKLANASLLTTEGDLTNRDAFVEVAHEALIRNWPQLRKWIDADRAGLRTRTRLTEAARDWKSGGHDIAYLYSGARLAVAKEWEASHPGELSTDEAEFLTRSLEAQRQREASEIEVARKLAEEQKRRADLSEQSEKEQKEASRKLRHRAWIAAGLGVTAMIFGALALVMMQKSAQSAEDRARIAEKQAQQAQQLFDDIIRGATDRQSPRDRRISLIWSLLPYWNSSDNTVVVVANTLASLILYDSDRGILSNSAEVIGHAYEQQTPKDVQIRLRRLLYGTAEGMVGVVPRCQLQIKADRNQDLYDARIEAFGQAIRKNWENLEDVNLRGAILNNMPLYFAVMNGAVLEGAELNCADLYKAQLNGALLAGARLRKASLRGASLVGADLRDADLTSADLRDAKLTDAKVNGANLSGAVVRSWDALKGLNGQFRGRPIVNENYPEKQGTPCDWPDWPTP